MNEEDVQDINLDNKTTRFEDENQFNEFMKRARWNLSPMRISFIRDFVYGMRNVFKLGKTVWQFRPWDYRYNLELLARSVEITANSIEKYGMEVDKDRLPRVEKMRRFVWLIDSIGNEIALAEKELGELDHRSWDEMLEKQEDGSFLWKPIEDEHTKKVFKRSDEIEVDNWDEMCEIMKTDMRGWWD